MPEAISLLFICGKGLEMAERGKKETDFFPLEKKEGNLKEGNHFKDGRPPAREKQKLLPKLPLRKKELGKKLSRVHRMSKWRVSIKSATIRATGIIIIFLFITAAIFLFPLL